MEQCSICQTPETKTVLFEVISPEGIIKVCSQCYRRDNFPLVRRNVPFSIAKEENVYNRMIKISGVNPESPQRRPDKTQQDILLKRIAEENVTKNLSDFRTDSEAKEELIPNFHWTIMRSRRRMHISQEKFANAIREPEKVIRLVESGHIPKDRRIIEKIENYLNIKLRKSNMNFDEVKRHSSMPSDKIEVDEEGYMDLDKNDNSEVKISDLQEMKKKKGWSFFS